MASFNRTPDRSAVYVPLISTTASFAIAVFEIIVFNGFDGASKIDKRSAARTISLWWQTTYFHGLFLILTMGLTSLISGILAIRSLEAGSLERRVAIVGTVAAVAHFAFAKPVVATIDAMCAVYDGKEANKGDGKRDDRAIELNALWLRLHLIRSFVADLPAVLCFAWLALRG